MGQKLDSPLLENGGLFVGWGADIAPLPWTHHKMVGYVRDANGKNLINCARADLDRASSMGGFGDSIVVAVNAHEALVKALRDARFAIEATEACLKTWNGGRGSPANVEGIMARIDEALALAEVQS